MHVSGSARRSTVRLRKTDRFYGKNRLVDHRNTITISKQISARFIETFFRFIKRVLLFLLFAKYVRVLAAVHRLQFYAGNTCTVYNNIRNISASVLTCSFKNKRVAKKINDNKNIL